jgi:hypothetical protein
MIILKCTLRKQNGGPWIRFIRIGQHSMAGSSELGNKPSGLKKVTESFSNTRHHDVSQTV